MIGFPAKFQVPNMVFASKFTVLRRLPKRIEDDVSSKILSNIFVIGDILWVHSFFHGLSSNKRTAEIFTPPGRNGCMHRSCMAHLKNVAAVWIGHDFTGLEIGRQSLFLGSNPVSKCQNHYCTLVENLINL